MLHDGAIGSRPDGACNVAKDDEAMNNARCRALTVLLGAAVFSAGAGADAAPAHHGFTVLYRFSGRDGRLPLGPLIADHAGNLYGTTEIGGPHNSGVVYELSPGAGPNGAWTETVLHSFDGKDGADPAGGLVMDGAGNLYGAAFTDTVRTGGAVFELSPGGGSWTFTQLYGFGSADSPGGSNPNGPLLRDAAGNLYGTTQYGGSQCACGTVFELSPQQNGTWSESVLHAFVDEPDGAQPYAPIVADTAGNLYGTTNAGGTHHCNDGYGDKSGCGTVFALAPSQGSWSETALDDFRKGGPNMPYAPVTAGADGAFYGTVGYDIFRLEPPKQQGQSWKQRTLYQFPEGIAGTSPASGVIIDASGNLYGVTRSSGGDGFSSAYELSAPKNDGGAWTLVTLAKFSKGAKENQPGGALLRGADGTLYGAVNGDPGYIFAIAP